MTLKQLLRVLHEYDTLLEQRDHLNGARRFEARNSPFADALDGLSHVRWMCQEVVRFLPSHNVSAGEPPPDPKEAQAKLEKAMRWLGFIQGVLWATGVRTIDEMRADNTRPA